MNIERRRESRFLPVKNSFAALGCNYSKVGKIKDVGLSGLSFEYMAGENGDDDLTCVDIFMSGSVFHLSKVPCRIVYDKGIHVPCFSSKYVKALTTKRCGVKFGTINLKDFVRLELFLILRTIGKVS